MKLRNWDEAQYLWMGMVLKYGKQVDADLQYQLK